MATSAIAAVYQPCTVHQVARFQLLVILFHDAYGLPVGRVQVPKPLAPQELEQLKQEIAAELHTQMAADTGSKHLSEEQLAQVGEWDGSSCLQVELLSTCKVPAPLLCPLLQ